MKSIAIITARSGSKGLHDKNVRMLCGKPLMAYTIEAAISCGMFEEVFVSTDSERYAEIARKYGAKVPFLRSLENATDNSSSWDVVRETLREYVKIGKKFEMLTLLQPTSPLRRAEDIIRCYELFREKCANSVISVCEMEHSPLLCNQLNESLSMENFIHKDYYLKARQEIPKYYRVNGALYMLKIKHGVSICDLYDKKCYAYVMPQERSIDIDTEFDFIMAEKMIMRGEKL